MKKLMMFVLCMMILIFTPVYSNAGSTHFNDLTRKDFIENQKDSKNNGFEVIYIKEHNENLIESRRKRGGMEITNFAYFHNNKIFCLTSYFLFDIPTKITDELIFVCCLGLDDMSENDSGDIMCKDDNLVVSLSQYGDYVISSKMMDISRSPKEVYIDMRKKEADYLHDVSIRIRNR